MNEVSFERSDDTKESFERWDQQGVEIQIRSKTSIPKKRTKLPKKPEKSPDQRQTAQ